MNVIKQMSRVIISLGFLGPALASAQIYDGAGFAQNNNVDVQAAVTIKISFGQTDRRRLSDTPRVGFGVGLAKTTYDPRLGSSVTNRVTLLDIGAYEFKTPSLQISGQELYGPTFVALNANEDADATVDQAGTKSEKNNTKWILLGAAAVALAVGTSVVVNEATETLVEDLED